MKSFLISALAIGALAAPSKFDTRQATAPVTAELPPRYYTELGSKRTKIRYGPYKLPSSNSAGPMSAMSGEKGMLTTVGVAMKKPCDDCGIMAMQAGLEYADGTPATTETGGWLHHVVMLVNGAGHQDGVCKNGLNMWAVAGERFFSSGNERTPSFFTDVTEKKSKSIYPLAKGDSLAMQLELMNMNVEEQTVWFTVDYEYLQNSPAGWKQARALWLDVTNCGISSVSPPANKNVFSFKMNPWTSDFNGQLLGTAGHLHDGGSNVRVYRNNEVICDSKAEYSQPGAAMAGHTDGHTAAAPAAAAPAAAAVSAAAKPATTATGLAGLLASLTGKFGAAKPATTTAAAPVATATAAAHSHGGRSLAVRDGPHGDGMPHIEVMTSCTNMGAIKKGDTLWIDANYDFEANMGMKGDRGYTPVMGIAIMFAALD